MNKYDILIFDWDGTIMNSRADIVGCLKQAIAACDLDAPEDSALANLIGLGLSEAFVQLYPGQDSSKIQQLCDAYRHAFVAPGARNSALFPGVRETLELLRPDYTLTVATGKSRSGLDTVLELSGLKDYFAITRTADETFSKPNPTMLFEIVTDLDSTVDKCLMIGDTDYDLNMASNAGMDSVAVSCGVHDKDRLLEAKPLELLPSVRELPEWLTRSE